MGTIVQPRSITTAITTFVVVTILMTFGASAAALLPTVQAQVTLGKGPCAMALAPLQLDGGLLVSDANIQHKSWQPRGGAIDFLVKLPAGTPANAQVRVCFRWQGKDAPEDFIEASAKIVDRPAADSFKIVTTIPPNLGSAPPWELSVKHFGKNGPPGVYTAFGLVPVADVRIMILNANNERITEVMTAMGVTSLIWGVFVVIASVVAVFWLLNYVCVRRMRSLAHVNWLLRVISTSSGYASLSQFQIFVWTLIIGASAVYVVALSGELINITPGALILLGISGASILTTKAQGGNEQKNLADQADKAKADHAEKSGQAATAANAAADAAAKAKAAQEAADAAPSPDAAKAAEAAKAARDKLADEAAKAATSAEDAAQSAAAAQQKQQAAMGRQDGTLRTPVWSDLIVSDGEIDVTRLQMFYFTLIAAVFVVIEVATSYDIPDIPQNFLILMGISNGVYVGSKFTPRSPSQAPASAPP